ncbi:MAG: cyclohexanecarboxyl-CoA dehydrogenase [Alphaproteobacteria bacterium]|nr:cyclohexanecarboxyl-CoA dehydrogenase [Alphaproteobacteria bacterium]
MDFSFSAEQRAFHDSVRRFCADKVAPFYREREGEGVISKQLRREMGELGILGVELPEKFGGIGLDCVTAGISIEEVGKADFNVAYIPLLTSLMGGIIVQHQDEETASRIIGEMCAGKTLMALGLTEPRGGSDAAHLVLKATKSGNGYILNGEKTSISLADQADQVVLFARTGGTGAKGVTAFIVPLNLPGISRTRSNDLGSSAVGRGSIFFDDVKIDADTMIGKEGQGFKLVMNGFDYSRALIGLQCLGAAAASLEETWKYVTERHAFGNPIAKYQGVTEPLAEAETLLTAARLLCYKTLWLRDHNEPHTAEAAMCKWWAPKTAFDIIHNCIIINGHFAYSREMPHQQRLRDVLGLQIGDGTPQIQKMIIAREKIGRVAVPY